MDRNDISNAVMGFFFPKLNRKFFLRIGIIAISAFVIFKWVCLPMKISGKSMEPTYHDGRFNFCWHPAYTFSKPERGDVVMVRFSGNSIMLLKRIVALEGETLEFMNGTLHINGKALEEPYVAYSCDWNFGPVQVKKGYVYVIGDNRNVPVANHQFGQTPVQRIAGTPLW